MISVRVEFDYEDVHYIFKAAVKWDRKEHEMVLTEHPCNNNLDITYYDGQYSIMQWDGDIATVEVVVDADVNGVDIHNVVLWDEDPNKPERAMKGEFEDYEEIIKGRF